MSLQGVRNGGPSTTHQDTYDNYALILHRHKIFYTAKPQTFEDEIKWRGSGEVNERPKARPLNCTAKDKPAQWRKGDLKPGDTLYPPTDWWHAVLSNPHTVAMSVSHTQSVTSRPRPTCEIRPTGMSFLEGEGRPSQAMRRVAPRRPLAFTPDGMTSTRSCAAFRRAESLRAFIDKIIGSNLECKTDHDFEWSQRSFSRRQVSPSVAWELGLSCDDAARWCCDIMERNGTSKRMIVPSELEHMIDAESVNPFYTIKFKDLLPASVTGAIIWTYGGIINQQLESALEAEATSRAAASASPPSPPSSTSPKRQCTLAPRAEPSPSPLRLVAVLLQLRLMAILLQLRLMASLQLRLMASLQLRLMAGLQLRLMAVLLQLRFKASLELMGVSRGPPINLNHFQRSFS